MSLRAEVQGELRQSAGHSLAAAGRDDSFRTAAHVLVAVAAFITGLVLGLAAEQKGAGSRVEWPVPGPAKPRPRSLQP
jgi:hypothetical protein